MPRGDTTKMAGRGGGSQSAHKSGQRVLFVSLFMILLAFFILLNAIAEIQQERMENAVESVGGAFGRLPSGLSPLGGKSSGPPGPPVQIEDLEPRIVRQVRDLFTGELGSGTKIRPSATGHGAVVEIESPSVFQGQGTELPKALADRIRRLGDMVRSSGVEVTVKGYTNLRLGTDLREAWFVSGRRAQNVVRLLHQRGVPLDRMRMKGVGDTRPQAAEYSEEGRRKNESVEIHLELDDKSDLKPLFEGGGLKAPITGGEG